ncbi:MAG: glycoside hydrolase family 127 protein [Clostridia bacterium]|nr:glycoside hydrolase family 127 protein [Clostridia bacterium]
MQRWNYYTSNEIKPEGWLRRQLEIQAESLAGNLDKVWRDVRDSKWIGGDAEGWERVPYWLDGFIPLAYLLEDEDMIARAKKYIDAIISFQKPSGWICPCTEEEIPTYDSWAVQLISKVLVVYYECSGDERIPEVLYRVVRNYYDLLSSGTITLFKWGKYRWFETFIAIGFLKGVYKEPWLNDLARILKDQGADYSKLTGLWKRPLNKWTYDTHIVNLAMMLKYEAVSHRYLGEEYTDVAEKLSEVLRTYNGTPVGLFTGDECLGGLSPIRGTELCSVAEQMYSYELLFAESGDFKWAERLEMLAFNALPATISDDMWAHQYDQQSNQIACIRFPGKPLFGTNKHEAHLFGLEPEYGCCTANFGQAWPKLALSTWAFNRFKTICSVVPLPSSIETEWANITLKTNYPFENVLEYTIEAKEDFNFFVRLPARIDNVRVNGKRHCDPVFLSQFLSAGMQETLTVTFDTKPEFIDRPHNLKSVRCGSLVFSLPIEYEKKMYEYERKGVERKFPYCDYEYIPKSDWGYAFSSFDFKINRKEVTDIPFSSEKPPVTLTARMRKISWGLEDGYEHVCAKLPESRTPISDEVEIELYPYGCAKLRMTEMPLI